MRLCRILSILASILITWSFSSEALAGGYATARFGGEHGHAASDHPTSVYYNPAGLALGVGTRIYVEGLFAYRQASYLRTVGAVDNHGPPPERGGYTPDDDPDALAANTGEATLSNFLASPFLGAVSDLGVENLGVAIGFYVPFGGQAKWDRNEAFEGNETYPGAFDGPQRWHSIEGVQRALYGTVAGAYRLPKLGLSFGLGVNVVYQTLDTLRARNTTGTDDLLTSDGKVLEGRTLIETADTSFSIGAGLLWEPPIDGLRVGLSYQSIPGFGESSLEGKFTNKLGTARATMPSDITLLLNLPDIVRFAATYQPNPNLELRFAADFTRWSVFERNCVLTRAEGSKCAVQENGAADSENGGMGILIVVPRDWNNSYGARVGASYWFSDALETFAGIGFDSSAVPDETLESAYMDMNKIISTIGVRYAVMGNSLLLTGSFTNVSYFEREIAIRPESEDLEQLSRVPDAAGTYDQIINFVTLGAQYAF